MNVFFVKVSVITKKKNHKIYDSKPIEAYNYVEDTKNADEIANLLH